MYGTLRKKMITVIKVIGHRTCCDGCNFLQALRYSKNKKINTLITRVMLLNNLFGLRLSYE